MILGTSREWGGFGKSRSAKTESREDVLGC